MGRIIKYDHSIIPACDVKDIEALKRLVENTCDVRGIGAYKIGSVLTIQYGLAKIVEAVRGFTDLPVIYDHQKAMTDIQDLGKDFVTAVKEAGANALIGFPLSGPETEEAWIKACKAVELEVIVGGEMTHPRFKKSEGGYVADECLDEMYSLGARLKVNNFVVPGNKAERVLHYKSLLKGIVDESLTFFAPGFVAQGGVITDVARSAEGISWHAIVGRAIYEADDMKAKAREMTAHLVK